MFKNGQPDTAPNDAMTGNCGGQHFDRSGREFSDFQDVPNIVNENVDNIQHNYELIYELKDKIEELKQEINALKLIQIISLKKDQPQKRAEKIS